MAASYPTSAKSFSSKATNDVVEASHVNDLQDEVAAIEAALLTGGVAHNVFPSTDGARTLGTSSLFWSAAYVDALVLDAATTSGIRLEVNSGFLDVREGDDSALAPMRLTTLTFGSAVLQAGTGSPESAVTGNVGDVFIRRDGGASTVLYIKESGTGNTGWVGK